MKAIDSKFSQHSAVVYIFKLLSNGFEGFAARAQIGTQNHTFLPFPALAEPLK